MSDPQTFYGETIPAHFNAALASQAERGEEGRRLYDEMVAVDATIRVDVEDGAPIFLNIEAGRMAAGESAATPPFLTLLQDRAAFERVSTEAGDSALALLGGLSGLAGELKLTRTRIDNLANLRGSVRFVVSDPGGFALVTHFGPDPVPEQPDASIRVAGDVYADLRGGRLDPTQAFMDGKLEVDGDLQLTMQLALAMIAPD